MADNRYTRRISGYFVDAQDFNELIYRLTEPVSGIGAVASHMPVDFDLDVAVGRQLDGVGARVGIGRRLPAPITDVYFTFDDAALGFDLGAWKGRYDPDSGLIELDDESYRMLIRAKIANNQWDGTMQTLTGLLEMVFPASEGWHVLVDDRQDMTMDVGVSGNIPNRIMLSLLTQRRIGIKPAGVRINSFIVPSAEGPLFGFDVDNEYIAGFDAGVWGTQISA